MERMFKTDPSVYCDTCEAMRRICAGCGKGPLLEGWLADDEHFCEPCGAKVDDCAATDSAGVEQTGLTLPQCYEVLGGDEGSDDVYYTEWGGGTPAGGLLQGEVNEDSCTCKGREYVIEVDVIVTRKYLVDADSKEDAMAKYKAGQAEIDALNDEMADWEEQEDTAWVSAVQDTVEDPRGEPMGEERNEEYDPDDGRCHDCGRVRPDWRSQTNCSICGVGLDWYCVDAHQCNTPQAAPQEDLAEEE